MERRVSKVWRVGKKMNDNDILEFLKKSKDLLEYCSCMDMAIRYQPKGFNYSEYRYLLKNAVNELCNEEDRLKIYNNGIGG